jgi:hypothetical protein
MSPPVSNATLYADHRVLVERVDNLQADVTEMRSTLHGHTKDIKHLTEDIWKVKIKISGYAAGAGVLTSVLLKLLDHIWK